LLWAAAFALVPGRAAASDALIKVCLQPLGQHDRRLLKATARGIEYLYGFPVELLAPTELPKSAYYPERGRYRAEKIVAFLDEKIVPKRDCKLIIGFTAVDISTTKDDKHKDWGILGLANIGGPSGVVSTFRVRRRASWRKQAQRIVKVANHELGHALGLEHINERACLMEDAAGTIATVDSESGLLCPTERRLLEEKQSFSPPANERFDWERVLGR
jgi:archaemetzincin